MIKAIALLIGTVLLPAQPPLTQTDSYRWEVFSRFDSVETCNKFLATAEPRPDVKDLQCVPAATSRPPGE